jgi:hypothetical protein
MMLNLFILVDSRLSEYARFQLESGGNRRGKFGFLFNRDWGKLKLLGINFRCILF